MTRFVPYKEAEVGNTVHCRVSAGDKMMFEFGNATAQLNTFDWSNWGASPLSVCTRRGGSIGTERLYSSRVRPSKITTVCGGTHQASLKSSC
jgi:hypothetical protein